MAVAGGTFYDLAARARRRSRLLLLVAVIFTALAGLTIGSAAWLVIKDTSSWTNGAVELPAMAALIGLALGLLAALFASSGAANAMILSSLRAREVAAAPTDEGERRLRNVVRELTIAGSLPEPKLYLISDEAINAMATGPSPERASIAVTTGALTALDREELAGVIAHELAHVRNYDIRFGLYLSGVAALFALLADLAFNILRFAGRGGGRSNSKNGGGALMLVVLVVAVACGLLGSLGLLFIRAASSRSRELLADASAVELTRNPNGLARALTKIAHAADQTVDTSSSGSAHLFFAEPRRAQASLLATHPLLLDRINALRVLGGKQPLAEIGE